MSSALAPPLVLASGSPRRRDMLSQLGLAFTVEPPHLDESARPGEAPVAYAARVAREKAEAVASGRPGSVVLAADTCVFLGDELFGKPQDPDDAVRMLLALSGREHGVATGVFVVGPLGSFGTCAVTRVRFKALSEPEARWYASTGEPLDKAGAYAIQGAAGAFVESIAGSHSNVIGLPLVEALDLLRKAGLSMPWEAP